MENEFFQWVANTSGTSILVLMGMYKMWNGTGKKIHEINKTVNSMDKRLVRVETKLEVED